MSSMKVPTHAKCNGESPLQAHHKRKYCGRVKRACQNCKKSKRCCDSFRPCSRCSRLGFEDSCVDAERKEKDSSSDSGERPNSDPGKRPKKVKHPKDSISMILKPDEAVIRSQTQEVQRLFEPNQLEKKLDLLSQLRVDEDELERRAIEELYTQPQSTSLIPPNNSQNRVGFLFPNQDLLFNFYGNDLPPLPQYYNRWLEFNNPYLAMNQGSECVPVTDVADEMQIRSVDSIPFPVGFAGQEFSPASDEELNVGPLDQVFDENSTGWMENEIPSQLLNPKRIDQIRMYNKLIEDVRKSRIKAQRALKKVHGKNEKEDNKDIPECAGTNIGDYDRIIEELQRMRANLNPSELDLELYCNSKEMAGMWLLKHGKFVDWNCAWEKFGYSEDDLFTKIKTWKDFIHHSEWERIDNILINAYLERKTEFSDSFTFVHKSGELSQVHITFVIIYEPGTSMAPLPSYTLCYNRFNFEN